MKRFSKTVLITAGVLLAVGIGLGVSGRAMGGETSMDMNLFGYDVTVGTGVFTAGVQNGSNWSSSGDQELEAFQSLEIDVDLGDVTVQAGDHYGVELEWSGKKYELHWSNENGLLRVWSTDKMPIGINLGSLNASATVTVPRDTRLERVEIQADLGRVSVSKLRADTLYVEADLGDVDVAEIDAEDVTLILDLGELSMEGLSAESVDVVASLGSVTGRDMTVREKLTVEADLGSVDLRGELHKYTSVMADLGSIRVDAGLPADECSYQLQVDMGEIRVDGKKQDDNASSSRGDNHFEFDASMGDIELNFN